MTTIAHTDVLSDGLNVIVNATTKLAICQTEPLTLADCVSLSGSGGKRVSTEVVTTGEITLGAGINANSLKINVPVKTFTDGILVGVSSGAADLWLAVYDGTRLLLKSDTITNQELILGATVSTPTFEFGILQV